MELCHVAASSSSSTAAAGSSCCSSGQSAPDSCTTQQQQQQLTVLEPLLQPWALVQVQLMQLSGMQLADAGWDVHCSQALLFMLDVAERKGGAARTVFKHALLQLVLLELLPHMQHHRNVWGTAGTPTASSSSSSSSGGSLETSAAAAFIKEQDSVVQQAAKEAIIELQTNLPQLLVRLVYEGELGTSH
jgi:hypothetical protein